MRKEQEMKVSFISVLYNCHWIAKYRALTECGNCSLYNHFNLLRFFQLHALKSLQFPRSKISKKKKKSIICVHWWCLFIYLFSCGAGDQTQKLVLGRWSPTELHSRSPQMVFVYAPNILLNSSKLY
jgi:hypothetical protein